MARIRRLFSRIASIATIMIATIPMSAISSSSSKEDPISAATRFHTKVFFIYVALLVLAAIFQWWVWSTNNRLQDAIRADSDARIVEAKAEGAKANERAAKLEKENLTLKGQVAGLETAASDSKAAQQRVETDLEKQKEVTARAEKDVAGLKRAAAEQQERAAKAELALLELQEKFKPRHLSDSQIAELEKLIPAMPAVPIRIYSAIDSFDGEAYRKDFEKVFKAVGREVDPNNRGGAFFSGRPIGVFIGVHEEKDGGTAAAAFLQRSLAKVGIDAPAIVDPAVPPGAVELKIGYKE